MTTEDEEMISVISEPMKTQPPERTSTISTDFWIYSCTQDSRDIPFGKFWEYVNRTTNFHANKTCMVQAHWQVAAELFLGELHGSTLLKDEYESEINKLFTDAICKGVININELNFVEVDYVCDGGRALFDVLHPTLE